MSRHPIEIFKRQICNGVHNFTYVSPPLYETFRSLISFPQEKIRREFQHGLLQMICLIYMGNNEEFPHDRASYFIGNNDATFH